MKGGDNMSRYTSNTKVMEMFKDIEVVRADNDIPDNIKNKKVQAMQNEIVTQLSFLVYNNARKYRNFPNYEDLVQEGFIGLIRAVQRFQHWRFPNFFVWSKRWITNGIMRSAKKFDVVYNPSKERTIYIESPEIFENHEDNIDTGPEERYMEQELGEKISEMVNRLPERDKGVIKKIFGIDGERPQTLREIGPQFGLTYERIRQIKEKALLKLRRNPNIRDIS